MPAFEDVSRGLDAFRPGTEAQGYLANDVLGGLGLISEETLLGVYSEAAGSECSAVRLRCV